MKNRALMDDHWCSSSWLYEKMTILTCNSLKFLNQLLFFAFFLVLVSLSSSFDSFFGYLSGIFSGLAASFRATLVAIFVSSRFGFYSLFFTSFFSILRHFGSIMSAFCHFFSVFRHFWAACRYSFFHNFLIFFKKGKT